MAGRTYTDNMNTLVHYFCVKNFPDAAKGTYNRELSHIPPEALTWVVDSILRDRRPTQGNFPTIRELKDSWFEWQRQNPNKVIRPNAEVKPCDSCGGSGILNFKGPIPCSENEDKKQQRYYEFKPQLAAWCGDCENWKRHTNSIDGERRFTKRYTLEQGWELWPYSKRPKVKGGVKEMASAIGKPMPDYRPDLSDPAWNERREKLRKQAEMLTANEPADDEDSIPF